MLEVLTGHGHHDHLGAGRELLGRHGLRGGRAERSALAWYGDTELAPHLQAMINSGAIDVELIVPKELGGAGGGLGDATPELHDVTWRVIGGDAGTWIADPWTEICAADVVVSHAGQNAVADLAARYLPLFLSQTIVSANLVITALLGTIMLNIALHTRDWVAIWLVVFSLCLLGMSSSHQTGDSGDHSFHWLLFFATIVLSVLALLSVYRLGRHGAIAGGAAAGLLFGVIAIAVRILDGLDPFDLGELLTDPALYAIILCGPGGFYMFTVALQKGSVSAASAALVVGETVVPGVIGILVLGDTTRAGWGAVAVIAFVAAVAGAVVVAIGMSLGGPTGYAINPARDLAPRLAHFVLPIPRKDDSNWGYAWVPVVGPVIGGVLAGLAAHAYIG